jgi:hypothetical protein
VLLSSEGLSVIQFDGGVIGSQLASHQKRFIGLETLQSASQCLMAM